MDEGQFLDTSQDVSDTFLISARSVVILRGTVSANWQVDARHKGSNEAWERWGYVNNAAEKQVIYPGVNEMEYRINLGTGNAGPTGFVYRAQVDNFR